MFSHRFSIFQLTGMILFGAARVRTTPLLELIKNIELPSISVVQQPYNLLIILFYGYNAISHGHVKVPRRWPRVFLYLLETKNAGVIILVQ